MADYNNPFDGFGNYVFNKAQFIQGQFCISDMREGFDAELLWEFGF